MLGYLRMLAMLVFFPSGRQEVKTLSMPRLREISWLLLPCGKNVQPAALNNSRP
jgi:hypothetical protein